MTLESLYRLAWEDARRNAPLMFVYMLVHVLVALASGTLLLALLGPPDSASLPSWAWAVRLTDQVLTTVIIALMQTLLLTRFGAEIDKPLWKSSGAGDAFRRFFVLWFIANLIAVTLGQMIETMHNRGDDDLAGALGLLLLFYQVVAFPVVVTLMYHGRMSAEEPLEALSALTRHPGATMSVFGFLLVGVLLGYWFHALLEPLGMTQLRMAVRSLAIAPLAILEFIMFAAIWRICMAHRDAARDESDYFDF